MTHSRITEPIDEVYISRVSVKQIIVIRKDLNMRKGKMAAQAAHASMQFLVDHALSGSGTYALTEVQKSWLEGSHAKVVVSVDSLEDLRALIVRAAELGIDAHVIVDEGRTEFHGTPTTTCAAFGPAESAKLDELTGKLPLL